MREYQRKKRAEKKGLQVDVNQPPEGLQKGVKSCKLVNQDVNLVNRQEFDALTERVQLLEETVAKLAASQAKVSVIPGTSIKRSVIGSTFTGPLSKSAQAHGHMPDNSPLGRMYRGEG
jgi:proline racemase